MIDIAPVAEILTAVTMVLGGQKGLETYRRKKYANGNGSERRRNHNSLSESDKIFIRDCFVDHANKVRLETKADHWEHLMKLEDVIRKEAEGTRAVIRGR